MAKHRCWTKTAANTTVKWNSIHAPSSYLISEMTRSIPTIILFYFFFLFFHPSSFLDLHPLIGTQFVNPLSRIWDQHQILSLKEDCVAIKFSLVLDCNFNFDFWVTTIINPWTSRSIEMFLQISVCSRKLVVNISNDNKLMKEK